MPDESEMEKQKAALRAAMLARLRRLTPEERTRASAIICRRIVESAAWPQAERVLVFAAMRTEPEITALTAVAKREDKLLAIVPTALRNEADLRLPFLPDLVLVPGLAFSREGHRLGRGGGFYDRLLAGRARAATKLGVAFASQLCPTVPHAAHDVLLDAVITD